MDFVLRQKESAALEIYPQDFQGKLPLVLVYHGFRGNCKRLLYYGYHLAKSGFFVVMPDAYNHGDRKSGSSVYNVFESVLNTSKEINPLIESYRGHPVADAQSTGITGVSMGGCIVFDYLAKEKCMAKAAAPIISSPEWTVFFHTESAKKIMKDAGMYERNHDLNDEERRVAGFKPVSYLNSFAKVPLLVQNGAMDGLYPKDNILAVYDRLKAAYDGAGEIETVLYENTGHESTDGMQERACEWFCRHLKNEIR